MKSFKEFIIELNKVEDAMASGKLKYKTTRKEIERNLTKPGDTVGLITRADPHPANSLEHARNLNRYYRKFDVKDEKGKLRQIKPKQRVDQSTIMGYRKLRNRPLPADQKDKYSKLAVSKKSTYPPEAKDARKNIDAQRNKILAQKKERVQKRTEKLNNLFKKSAKRKGKSEGMD